MFLDQTPNLSTLSQSRAGSWLICLDSIFPVLTLRIKNYLMISQTQHNI